MLKKGTKLLLYCSYCEEDGCTDAFPCKPCLDMSNVFVLSEDAQATNVGGLVYTQFARNELLPVEQYLKSIGFQEVEPIGSTNVFIRDNIRFSITGSDGGYYHAGHPGQDMYSYTYRNIPTDVSKIDRIIKELEATRVPKLFLE